MGENAVKTERLNFRKPLHRRVAKQTRATFRHVSKASAPRLIEKSGLDRARMRLTFQVIDRQITDLIWVWDQVIPEGDADTACGVHVDDCPVVLSPCLDKGILGPCTEQVNCGSEACADSFACAGTHVCNENACSDVTCHPDAFGCTDHVVPCTAEAPPTCPLEDKIPPCDDEVVACVGDEPEDCTQEVCVVDEPEPDGPGEDEGSDSFGQTARTGLVKLFRSRVWEEVVLELAASKPTLDTEMRNTSITLNAGLFRRGRA